MREKEILKKMVAIPQYSVKDIQFKEGNEETPSEATIVLQRDETRFRCACGYETTGYYDSIHYFVRDLPYGKWSKVFLDLYKYRIQCPGCGVVTEQLEWICPFKRYTTRLSDAVALSCRALRSISDVAEQYHLSWDIVKDIDKEYLSREFSPPVFDDDLEYLAMDEFSLKKRHKYATNFVDPIRRKVLYTVKGRSFEDVKAFFELLGKERCEKIKAVCVDMWDPYIKAVRTYCPNAEIVYDLFHIVQNFGKVIDKVRNNEIKKASSFEKDVIKGSKYLLLSNAKNLTHKNRNSLKELLALNKHLSTVYILKDELKHLWSYTSEAWFKKAFNAWYRKAIYSKIEPLKEFARSLKRRIDGIIAHCKHKLNTSFLEGMNNKIKVIKRVAFGFRDSEYFFLSKIPLEKIRASFA
ncbi:MAG: ISL3 family transposase [Candidatus Desulfaltia sp.]|nr:ISL3 family transposase [Candidatus Desulfaltia sp.]